jgi:hypothetical protein
MIKKTILNTDKATHSSISLVWEIDPKIQIVCIILKLKKHNPPEDLGSLKVSSKAIGYEITSLHPETLYEVQIAPCDAKRQYSWSNIIIAQTHKLPSHQLFYPSEKKFYDQSIGTVDIINARNLKDWKEYVYGSYKFARPKELRPKILERTLAWVNASDTLDNEYYINHSCSQGPFVLLSKSKKTLD